MDANFQGKRPKARKPHECTQCGRTVEVGEVYYRPSGVFDGRVYSLVVCLQCEAFAKALKTVGFEDDEGNYAWLPELDAGEVAYCGFAREYELYRARWRNLDGELVVTRQLTDHMVGSE